jgi:hypothetical protein
VKVYHFDLTKSPHLATPEQLFGKLNQEFAVDGFSVALLTRGFRKSDVKLLKSYVKQYNINDEV